MGASVAVAVPVGLFVLSAIGIAYWRLIYLPGKHERQDNAEAAEEALDRAREALGEVKQLRQMLTGTDAAADEGVLQRLNEELSNIENELTQIRGQIQRQARVDTERTEQVQQVVQSLDNIDGVTVEERADGYIVHSDEDFLRGGETNDPEASD